jgi:cell division septum initiation protein DivIVA
MSLSQSFFPSETEEILNPQFTKTLKGFSVEEVESYVDQAKRRIEVLELHLDKALEERDFLRHELASAKSDAYKSAGERLGGILRNIDEHVEGIRREAEEAAALRVAEAERQAEALRKTAEEDGARVRGEAALVLKKAQEEAERVLGGLTERRNILEREIEALRGVLISLLERLTVPSGPAPHTPPVEDSPTPPPGDEESSPAPAAELKEDAEAEPNWAMEIDQAVVDLRDVTADDVP